MSNAELVMRLEELARISPISGYASLVREVIAEIQTARDDAFEQAAVKIGFHGGFFDPATIEACQETIRALKSKPATSTADDTEAQRRSWLRGEMAMGESVAGTKPWTRADDTTSPVRGKVEDRRKSEFGNLERAPEVKGQSLVDEWAAYRVNIDWERPATMLDLKIAMRAVGDELDTRLGEKS